MTTAIQTVQDYGLTEQRQHEIQAKYSPFSQEANTLLTAAKGLSVVDESDVDGMKRAREIRLGLKALRVATEKTRKELKDSALREGKAIDGYANIIKNIIVPAEQRLQEMEDIVKLAEERRKQALAQSRAEALGAFDIDTTCFDLANMQEDAYSTLLQSSEAGYKARIKAEEDERARIEAELIAAKKAEAEKREAEKVERERIEAENRQLREQAEAARIEREKAEAERQRVEAERLEKEATARREQAEREAEAQRVEQERINKERAELDRQRKEQEERLQLQREKQEAERVANEAKQAQAALQSKYDAMKHKATCPKCGHVFDAELTAKDGEG